MNFEKVTAQAQTWVTTSKTRFELTKVDTDGKRLTFASTLGEETFYVVGPTDENGGISWHVWSDNDAVLSRLHHVIDSLQSSKERALPDILHSINKALAATQGAAAVLDADDEDNSDDLEDEDDDYDEAYYEDEDPDALESESPTKETEEDTPENDSMYSNQGNPIAVKRLLKDWKNMKDADKFSISACPKGDNLFIWDVKLLDFPKESQLGKDLKVYAAKYKTEPVITMEMLFPQDYPMAPPFVRIVRPRFEFLTGHVTVGGSICMELLTRSGWRPTNDIENIIVQIRSEIMSDSKATLDKRNAHTPYDKIEAQRAFDRMVQRYGWNK